MKGELAGEFIRRYLMHVLPNGFMRIRHYGLMGSGCDIPQDELMALVRMAQGFEVEDGEASLQASQAKTGRMPGNHCPLPLSDPAAVEPKH